MKTNISFIAHIALAIICIAGFSSCASNSYTKAIPTNSTAIMAIDAESFCEEEKDLPQAITSLLNISDATKCGLDLSQKIYMFGTSDGNLGTCIKVSDSDDIEQWLNSLNGKGLCSKPTKKRDFTFALLKGSWEIGLSDEVFVMIGPILPAQQADAIRNIRRYLKQEDENSDKTSPLFERLNDIKGAITLVAQIDALPDKISAPLTLAQPAKADGSQIILAASMEKTNGNNLIISGNLFSLNSEIDNGIKANLGKFKSIEGKFTKNIPSNSLCAIFMNMQGNDLVNMTHNSKQLGVMLAGVNTAIDMDNILRCTDGDFALSIDSYSDTNASMSMAAKLSNRNFLKDVDYWKKSCPSGSRIDDYGKDSYKLHTPDTSFWFGATDSNEFFGSTDEKKALSILKPCSQPYPNEILSEIKGKKLCMVINMPQILKQMQGTSDTADFLAPLFGKIGNIVFSIE